MNAYDRIVPRRRPGIAASLAIVIAAFALACGGDKATGPSDTIAGNYTLRTVNGATLPVVVFQSQTLKQEILAGNITLGADGKWSGSLTSRETTLPSGSPVTFTLPASGNYVVDNGAITLNTPVNGALAGTVGGGTLTIRGDVGTGEVLTLVFKK
jgi:hypothetical protein